jgi:hypothetical protein
MVLVIPAYPNNLTCKSVLSWMVEGPFIRLEGEVLVISPFSAACCNTKALLLLLLLLR